MLWSAITSQLLPPFSYLQICGCTGNLVLVPWHIYVTVPMTASHCSSFFHLSAQHFICLQFPVLIQSSVDPFQSGTVPLIRHPRVKSMNQWAKVWSPADLNLPCTKCTAAMWKLCLHVLVGRVLRAFCWLDTEHYCCWWRRGLSSGSWFLEGKIWFDSRFQASATKKMRTALFWVITQRFVVISYRRFGTLVPSSGFKKMVPRLSRNVGRKLPLLLCKNPEECSPQFGLMAAWELTPEGCGCIDRWQFWWYVDTSAEGLGDGRSGPFFAIGENLGKPQSD